MEAVMALQTCQDFGELVAEGPAKVSPWASLAKLV